jgi:biopolymer transport protein ExbD
MTGGGGDGEFDVNINLTALLDVLTNLLFFLLVGYAAQQVNMEVESGVVLPTSSAEGSPTRAIQVIVGQRELRVEKEFIAPIQDGQITLLGTTNTPGERIEPLYRKLVALREQRVATTLEAPDALMVLCDKGAPYALLRRVLMTAGEAGFPKFRMAVLMQ